MINVVVHPFIPWDVWVPVFFLGVLGLPLIIQDLKNNTVSQWLLILVALIWLASAALTAELESRLTASAVVLLLGGLLLAVLPGRLGEADVVFMAGMASLFSFWPLLFSLALACLASLSAFLWRFQNNQEEAMQEPIPFLPSLYWGGLTISLRGLLF